MLERLSKTCDSSSTESYRARCDCSFEPRFLQFPPALLQTLETILFDTKEGKQMFCVFNDKPCIIEPLILILIPVDVFRQPFRWAEHNFHFSRDIYDIPLRSFPPCWRFPFLKEGSKPPDFKHFPFVNEANCLDKCRR